MSSDLLLRCHPVNGLLALSYTLLATEMLSTVQEVGLDPALGQVPTWNVGMRRVLGVLVAAAASTAAA